MNDQDHERAAPYNGGAAQASRWFPLQQLDLIPDAVPHMVWSATADGLRDYHNARWYEFTGAAEGAAEGDGWLENVHEDDRQHARDRWYHSVRTAEPYEAQYRLCHQQGGHRWTLCRASPVRDACGAITRWFGTCTDIDDQQRALEDREAVTQELSHRIKNIFSVIAGLIGLSAGSRTELAGPMADLRDRVIALGRAHDFVRPDAVQRQGGFRHTSLHGLLNQLFRPYHGEQDAAIVIEGEDPDIDDRSATPLALVFHELATNAVKYGALSYAGGSVRVHIGQDGSDWLMQWVETGGPQVDEPTIEGFGGRLIALSVERQLGGKIWRAWTQDGLSAEIRIPVGVMSRPRKWA